MSEFNNLKVGAFPNDITMDGFRKRITELFERLRDMGIGISAKDIGIVTDHPSEQKSLYLQHNGKFDSPYQIWYITVSGAHVSIWIDHFRDGTADMKYSYEGGRGLNYADFRSIDELMLAIRKLLGSAKIRPIGLKKMPACLREAQPI
jgi:hypothetical protein